MTRRGVLRIAAVVMVSLGVTALVGAGAAWRFAAALPPLALEKAERVSITVLDRQDRLLRAFTTPDDKWRLPVEPADVDPRYIAMLKAFEDRRFDRHNGIDGWALLRAAGQLVRHARIVSGGSTLTMQVARLIEGDGADLKAQRSAAVKLRQMIRAVEIERRLSKSDILRLYLRLAPFGGNIEGVRAASLAYFGHEPRRLSIGEAALLVAIPQSPGARRPDRHPEAARRARARVLDRAVAAGVISKAEARRAAAERIPAARREFPKLSPHLAEAEVGKAPRELVHRLTLDRDLQASLETLAREQARGLGATLSAAILVADHRTGEILAYVGSSDYLDQGRRGAIDMISAVRSPGSTLKPIIYGLGFEAGLIHPATLIEDRPVRFGAYAPRNFDDDFHGTVTIRDALQQSLNIPAVKLLNAVGPGRLLGRFRRLGVDAQLPAAITQRAEPTLAVALGGVGLRLGDLAVLYAALARGGDPVTLTHLRAGAGRSLLADHRARLAPSLRRLVTPVAAWYVTDILKDAPPPIHGSPGRLAYKTGTSYGYRDALAIGYDGQHVVAVWVGRADGATTTGLTGRTAAAPLLFDAFQRLGPDRAALAGPPAGALIAAGGELPPNLKRFHEPGELAADPSPFSEPAVGIAFPPDRAELELDDGTVVLKAEHGTLPLTWLVDGRQIASDPVRREVSLEGAGAGFMKVTVIDAKGRVDRVTVRVR